MGRKVTQTSYNSGEIGDLLAGRTDDSKYASGLAECKNAYPTPQGPVMNRAGFMYVNEVRDSSKKTRLIPFVYSADQQIVVELGDYSARFHRNGQTLMTADGSKPYEIWTPWPSERLFDLHYTQNADIMTLVCSGIAPCELRRYSINDWRLAWVDLSARLSPPGGVNAYRTQTAANDSNADRYTQRYVITALNEDRTRESSKSLEASVVANLYATGTLVRVTWNAVAGAKYYRVYKYQGGIYGYIGETEATWIEDDNIAPETGTTPPIIDTVFGVSGGITKCEIVNAGWGYAQGGTLTSVSNSGYWENRASFWGPTGQNTVTPPIVFTRAGNAPSTTPDVRNIRAVVADRSGRGSGAAVSVNTTDTYNSYGYWTRTEIKGFTIISKGSGYTSPLVRLSFNTRRWDDNYNYENGVHNWNSSWRKSDDVAVFDCSVSFDTVSLEVYDDGGQGYGAQLGFTTDGGRFTNVYVISPGQNYTNPKVRVVSSAGSGASFKLYTGSSGDYPTAVGYFEQRRVFAGSLLNPQQFWMTVTGTDSNMSYHLPLQDTDRISFKVASRDLNQIQHIVPLQQLIALTSAGEWRVSPLNSDAITPSSISVRPQSYIGASKVQPQIVNSNLIYAAARGGHIRELSYQYQSGGYVTGDVSIRAPHLFTEENVTVDMALTKSPDPIVWCVRKDGVICGLSYIPEQKIGSWFTYQTDGAFESATVVSEGDNDYLYVVVLRNINGTYKRLIERQQVRNDVSRGSGCFLDCAGKYQGNEEVSRVTGVHWLNGMNVTVVADGAVLTDVPVKDGVVELPQPAKTVWVGLPYETKLKTLPVSVNGTSTSYGSGYLKNIRRVLLRVSNTQGIEVGATEDTLKSIRTRSMEVFGAPPALKSGTIDVTPLGNWQPDGSIIIRQSEPLPFTLISHTVEAVIGEA